MWHFTIGSVVWVPELSEVAWENFDRGGVGVGVVIGGVVVGGKQFLIYIILSSVSSGKSQQMTWKVFTPESSNSQIAEMIKKCHVILERRSQNISPNIFF